MENVLKPNGNHSIADGAMTGMHGAVDRTAAVVGQAAMGMLPVVDGVAQRAHAAVDKVGDVISTPDAWVRKHPLESLGIAFAAGLVVGRLFAR
ncbi:MAG TPA: hypothetical protein VLJ57_05760 [Burkholderiaceae bacterium]|nr:hypothetical protein [Burkholderiaceae bacterium]